MSKTLAEFDQLVNAEDYFKFFDLAYDAQILAVNRLHILQKFSQFVQAIEEGSPNLTETDRLDQYRAALQSAYEVFTTSSAVEQKLFKVFQQKPQNVVLLSDISVE